MTLRNKGDNFVPMKKQIFILSILFLLVTSVFAGAFLEFFHARSEGENVKLEWKTGEEQNVKNFVIERKPVNGQFISISTIAPKGSFSFYTFVDESAYKSNNLVFIYRLRIIDNDGSVTHSIERSVSPNISGVKRTWGSIKAMFR